MSVCSKKEKWSEVSLCDEVNASAPCSVEFTLKACFPDDKQQTYLAKGIPFRATNTPQGIIEGVLDSNGSVVIPDVGIGNVTIEVLPDVDEEIVKLRNQIKTALDGVIKEERDEASNLAESYNKKSYLGKVGENLKSEAKGVGNIAVGIWDGIKAIGGAIKEVGEQAGEYLLDPLNAPETFKEDVAAVKAKYHELKHTTNQALEIYHTLKEDDDTWKMLKKFSEDYYDAQHSTEIFEHGAELTVGVILTLFTGGAAAAALGTRFAVASAKLAPLLEKLAKMLKDRQWFKKRQTVEANKKETVSTVHKPKNGQERAAKYAANWPKASKTEAVEKFGCNKTPIDNGKKLIYKNEETGIDIVEDKEAGYFRIQDTTFEGKGERYLNMDGEYPQNETINGKQRGINKKERQRLTHFENKD